MAKLRQQSGDAEGYVAAQTQALKLQVMLADHVRQPGAAAAAAAVFDQSSGTGTAAKHLHGSFLTSDGGSMAARAAAVSVGAPPGAAGVTAGVTASASSKAASICFDLAEFHRQRHQLDKVGTGQYSRQ